MTASMWSPLAGVPQESSWRCAPPGWELEPRSITRDGLGGTAASDGPVPVRTLAHAARLIREARQLPCYGITAGNLRSTIRG